MSRKLLVGKAIKFNPSESITKGSVAKKIPMGALTEYQRKINEFEYSEYKSGPKFRNGDTLVAKITPCLENGKTAFVDLLETDEVAFGSSEFIVLRQTEYTTPEFIYYFARSPLFRERAISCMEGTSGRKRVNENSLKNLDFIFPDLPTQKSIAIVLSDLDAKIELNNKINRELESMAKTLYDYWFVQFDFPDANGRPYKSSGGKMVYNAELKREIPEGWEVKELGKLIDIQRGISYKSSDISGGGIPMISLNSFNLDGTYKAGGIKSYSGKYTDKQIAKSEDLLIAATDVTRSADIIGKAIMVPHYYKNDLVFSMDIAKIIPKKDISSPYLMMLFNSDHYHNYIKWYASGTIVLHLNMDGVKWYKAEIPPTDLIEKFDSFYLPIANRINETERQNEQLTALRDWLLPMLMNGQITVKEAEDKLSMAAEPSEKYGN